MQEHMFIKRCVPVKIWACGMDENGLTWWFRIVTLPTCLGNFVYPAMEISQVIRKLPLRICLVVHGGNHKVAKCLSVFLFGFEKVVPRFFCWMLYVVFGFEVLQFESWKSRYKSYVRDTFRFGKRLECFVLKHVGPQLIKPFDVLYAS